MALTLFATVLSSRADVVAEWKFDGTADVAAGGVVNLDNAAAGASKDSKLQSDTRFVAGSTGMSASWASFLKSGFLEVGAGGGDGNKNRFGLVTQDNPAGAKNGQFRRYLGYSGLSPDKSGSVCVIVSPGSDWTTATRRGFFSTGHSIDGSISLAVQKTGPLVFRVGGKKEKFVDASVTRTWLPGKWYFIGASWGGGKKSVLVVYEIGPDLQSTLLKSDSVESTEPCPTCEQPRYDPLVVGANWYNTGGECFTNEGADGRLAYLRVDNTFADAAAFKAILTSLAAANPAP